MLRVYVPTAIGGLILNYLLFKSRIVPRPVAVLGTVGYTLLLLVVPLDLLGAVEENSGVGLALLAPGGIYEFAVLPIWLIARGFRTPNPEPRTPKVALAAAYVPRMPSFRGLHAAGQELTVEIAQESRSVEST